MTHTHPGTQLHVGCDACIDEARRSDYTAAAHAMSVDQLVEALAGRDHMHNDWKHAILTNELAHRPAWAAS